MEDRGWFGIQSVLKSKWVCPPRTQIMKKLLHEKEVDVCVLKLDDMKREGMNESIEHHKMENVDIPKDPLIFCNPASQIPAELESGLCFCLW